MSARTATAETDPDEEGRLVRLHRGRVLRTCRLLLADAVEAEDVTQDVMIRMIDELRCGETVRSWPRWLATVAIHACHDRRRTRWWSWWTSARDAFAEELHSTAAAGPERVAAAREIERRVMAGFAALSLRQREVFLLRQVEGFSTAETAAALGIDDGSVKRHLFRALARLRPLLEEVR